MTDIETIQQAILSLSKEDYIQLKRWLSELDWEEWDKEIEDDSASGKLDSLISEAAEAQPLAPDGNAGLERGSQP